DQPQRVAAVCRAFTDVITSGGAAPPDGQGPLTGAFAHVWRRLTHQASPAWTERTAEHWRWYLDAYTEEAANRAGHRTLSRTEYIALRRKTGLVYAMLDLSQKAYGFELPHHLHTNPTVRRMLDITADVVDTLNDVHSLEKEESRGDPHNLVLVIEQEHGCDRTTAITETQQLIHNWCQEFLTLEDTLRASTPEHDTPLTAILTDSMRSAMSGYLHWSRTSKRYSHLIPPSEPALITDLVTALPAEHSTPHPTPPARHRHALRASPHRGTVTG
ncbi:terpene synthase family protein, partial [Streptomyces sp. NPDC005009]